MTDIESVLDTVEHIQKVRRWLTIAIANLQSRLMDHDASKLRSPELEGFLRITARLRDIKYGSDEYRAALREEKPTIEHHQKANDHHPEFFKNGIAGMDCFQLIEMLCDWKAAGERTKDGSMVRSLEINRERFGMGTAIFHAIVLTAHSLAMITHFEAEKLLGEKFP